MKVIVIDASMAATWIIEEEKSPAGNAVLEEVKVSTSMTPSLFWHEIRNILWKNEKRGKIPQGGALLLLQSMRTFGIVGEDTDDDALILSLANQYDLTAYDAAYLALALRENAILATNDRKLAQAALACGLELRTVLDEVFQ